MATLNNAGLVFYPAFCFKASPTHFAWVKMAAVDVHRLRRQPGFEGQNIFFYNNHPIRFVSFVGLIVARTEITRRTILTLDDSSGATIDVAVLQAEPEKSSATAAAAQAASSTTKYPSTVTPTTHISATERTELDITTLTPGTSVRVKGTLSQFRSRMQLNLERYELIRDTNAEMEFLDSRLRFLVEVLSKPWVLLDSEIEGLRIEAEHDGMKIGEEKRRADKRARKRKEREERDQRLIARRYEKEERRRAQEAGVLRVEGGRAMGEMRQQRDGSL
ncbi:hypothetical protein N7510_006357 [Penicillium lagena]|uniref:uncharacterized protein n=1 Tax=Penicillium lagena TaxID=94218 RepID=UPI00253F8AF9|nr:uncharacterized protein N7510_006357 [Penicillium lagena]KAJ5613163.1 hypothetical protein N7510_006357 [Penicillium lagena]